MASSSDDDITSSRRRSSLNPHPSPQQYQLSKVTSAPQPGIVSEHAIASDSSLSRSGTPGSTASTRATSIDNQHLTKVRTTSHGSTGSVRKPSPSGSLHPEAARSGHHASQTLDTIPQAALPSPVIEPADSNRRMSGSTLAPPIAPGRADSTLSAPVSTTSTLKDKISNKNLVQNSIQLGGLIVALVSAVLYSYRSYVISCYQAQQAFYNNCLMLLASQRDDDCNATIAQPLQKPPYSKSLAKPKLHKRGLEEPVSPGWEHFLVYMTVLGGLLITLYTMLVLWQSQTARRTRNAWADQSAPRFDSFWLMSRRQRPLVDPFSPVNVRLAPYSGPRRIGSGPSPMLSKESLSTGNDGGTTANPGGRRRFMPIMPGASNSDTHHAEIRRKSLQVDLELSKRPPWKKEDGLKDESGKCALDDDSDQNDNSTTDEEFRKLSTGTRTRRLIQIGDALKGHTDDDLLIHWNETGNVLGNLRHKLHAKYPKLPYLLPYNLSDEALDPPFTALGADDDDTANDGDDENVGNRQRARRKNVVLSGFVAVGMAQSGAALASSVGGAIGQEVLVQSIEKEGETLLPDTL